MGKLLKNPPVYLTVAQIRFNTILNLNEYLPKIQDELRKNGYPEFHKYQIFGFTLSEDNQQPIPTQFENFIFGDLIAQNNFVINSDSITTHSTCYGDFQSFSEKLMLGARLLNEIIKVDFITRIGLRYLDHVTPQKNEGLNLYLDPGVLGAHGKFPGISKFTFSETLNENNGIQLRSKVFIQDGPISTPPDLVPQGLNIEKRFKEYSGIHAILDNDGFIEEKSAFNLDQIQINLVKIHTEISRAFKTTVTKHALEVWNK
jgi:uncharacterized protein (TIGR04255 family)